MFQREMRNSAIFTFADLLQYALLYLKLFSFFKEVKLQKMKYLV